MQTILGAGGAIGKELALALKAFTSDIRLASRHPQKVNETDQLWAADLLNREAVFKAVEGSEVVYVTVGFPYNYRVWQKSWPPFIRNVIDACVEHGAKLVFFDNIYMYDPQYLNGMDESTPINPPSRKGRIRAEIAGMIMDKVKEGKLTALIARSADFYGPGIQNTSLLTEMVFKPLREGKKANWLASVDHPHAFTYTPDAGRATAMLGNAADTWNQVWHLPTAGNPYTGREWIQAVASALGVKPRIQIASSLIVRIMGLFIPVMREMPEMMYQYDRDYVFNSDKFNARFNFHPTSYKEGIRTIVTADYAKNDV
jgi:nucleoside-diphosphate-sugar epimerase